MIVSLAAHGCRTVLLADEPAACHDLSRMLGEPRGLFFVTPLAPLEVDVRGLAVEIASATRSGREWVCCPRSPRPRRRSSAAS